MRVIITGGTGLIGRELAKSLSGEGHDVMLLSRSPERVKNLPGGVRAVGWDGKSAAGWGPLADGADAIVNLAGESIAGTGAIPSRWTEARKKKIIESRTNAAQAILEAVQTAANKPRVLIQASAVGYYGPCGDEVVTEAHEVGNDFLAHVCTQWENSSDPIEALGVRRAILRTGLVLSTEGGVLPKLMLPFHFFAGGPLGSGKQWYPWIHIGDQIGAIRFLITKENARGVYNLSAPNPLTNRDFSKGIGKVMHRPSFMPAPAFAFKLAFGETATLILDGQRAVPQRLTEAGYRFQFSDAESALRDLLNSGRVSQTA